MTSYGSKLRHASIRVATSKSSSCLLIISEDRENEGHEEFFEKKLPSYFLNQLLLVFTATFNNKTPKRRGNLK